MSHACVMSIPVIVSTVCEAVATLAGNLRSMISKMATDSPIRATIADLDQSQSRISGLTTLKQPLYGTSRCNSSSSSTRNSRERRPGSVGGVRLGDAPYGSPELTPAQQKLAEKLRRAEVAKPCYTFK